MRDFLKEHLGSFSRANPEGFNAMLEKMKEKGYFEPEDLTDMSEADLDSLELPSVQKRKLYKLTRGNRGIFMT